MVSRKIARVAATAPALDHLAAAVFANKVGQFIPAMAQGPDRLLQHREIVLPVFLPNHAIDLLEFIQALFQFDQRLRGQQAVAVAVVDAVGGELQVASLQSGLPAFIKIRQGRLQRFAPVLDKNRVEEIGAGAQRGAIRAACNFNRQTAYSIGAGIALQHHRQQHAEHTEGKGRKT